MPSYTYECKDCEETFDIIHGINEVVEVIECKCGSKNVKRIYKPISSTWKCGGNCGIFGSK